MLEMVASELVNTLWHRGSQAHDTPIPLSPMSKLYISETKRHCQGQAYRKLDSGWAKLAEVALLCGHYYMSTYILLPTHPSACRPQHSQKQVPSLSSHPSPGTLS